jgi:GNAT superfamily N-acetyltransferase
LCFGVYRQDKQAGFARVVTDYSTFAWLCDVFILPEFRGLGLAKWLVQTIVEYPDFGHLRRFILATKDASSLYQKYAGFVLLKNPERWMERLLPNE